jgi:putative SOS response-associated peptidase YedK
MYFGISSSQSWQNEHVFLPPPVARCIKPYAIVPTNAPLFAVAGLWENGRDKAAGDGAEWIRTCAIITGSPNELVSAIHDRVPVILPREAWARWLGEEEADRDELQSLLKPYPAERRTPSAHGRTA